MSDSSLAVAARAAVHGSHGELWDRRREISGFRVIFLVGHCVGMGVAGFDELFEEHQGRIVRLCWLLTLDGDVASEVAQETFTRAWSDRVLLEGDGFDAGGWLRRVAVNLCWDRSRRRASRRRRGHLVASPARSTAVEANVDLHRAIGRLSTRQRQAVILRYWDDLDLTSCAEVMGVSVGSVKQHLARAHAGLARAPELAKGDR